MALSHAIIAYDAAVFAVLGLDFIVFSRRNDTIVSKGAAALMLMVLIAITPAVAAGRIEFLALGAIVLGAAVFAYANFLAFVKRGVTFSILSNHTRPPADRLDDEAFIAIEDRLHEMRQHGWADASGGRWTATPAGRRVARIRARLLRIFRIEAVG